MNKHFIDYCNNVSNQCFSSAAIVLEGVMVGKVIIRFTKATIGYNHNVGVLLNRAEIDFGDTRKGGIYSQPTTLIELFNDYDVICMDHFKMVIREPQSLSSFNEVKYIEHKGLQYELMWVM